MSHIQESTLIKDVYIAKQIPMISRTMRYGELKEIFSKSVNDCFPVCDESGEIIGCINWHQARPIFFEPGLESLLVAQDFMTTPPATLRPDDSLYEALMKILNSEQREILIVNAANPTQVLGILSHEDLMHAYNREILRRKTGIKLER